MILEYTGLEGRASLGSELATTVNCLELGRVTDSFDSLPPKKPRTLSHGLTLRQQLESGLKVLWFGFAHCLPMCSSTKRMR